MARPRLIRLPDGGEITLKNVSPELADKIKALALGGNEEESAEAQAPQAPAPSVRQSFPLVALGTALHQGQWCAFVVGYDPASGEAAVQERMPAGPGKDYAAEKFKLLAVEHRII